VEYGAHLPLIDFGEGSPSLDELTEYAATAERLGFRFLCTNDHLLFGRPWLDGPIALAAVLAAAGEMQLATTVSIPVVRGPVQAAKSLAAIDRLSGGRLTVGVGPGSSARDYEAVGLPFEDRWSRLDEVIAALRALWAGGEPFVGRHYSTEGISLSPPPTQRPGPPIWIGSWGSPAGLRRAARHGDGWIASGYNTTPARFGEAREALAAALAERGRDAEAFPNALSTGWLYITEDAAEARRVLHDVLVPTLHRDPADLAAWLPIGSAEHCAGVVRAYAEAGLQRLFVWPLAEPARQLERFAERVIPLVDAG
jgi:alkanesulfonate monooxygenase SsuD/methylene tetrahydromethanopterin reductase-like flavin-dependent oxidoreductase (luciferase family)